MNTTLLKRIRIPPGHVLRVPHGGKPELRALTSVPQVSEDTAKLAKRRTLMEKAEQLGMKDALANGHSWSLERLEGAVFDRFCLWGDAKRSGVRGTSRRWSDAALYRAMLMLKRQGR